MVKRSKFFEFLKYKYLIIKERERLEREMKAKMEERNKHAEFVRQNKEKLAKEGDTVPESA